MAVTCLPDGRWICYWNDPISKRRKKEYFGRGPEAEAAAYRRNKELTLRRGRPPSKRYGPTFSALAELYYKKKGFDRKPRESLSYRLDAAILPVIGHRHAMSFTTDHLDDYVASRRCDGVKDNTIAREITDIKAILNWSTRRQPPLIPVNPVRDFKGPSDRDEIILPPEPDEISAIYKNAAEHLKRFITLASYIGARPGAVELFSLTWASVSWASRTVRVISADKRGPPLRHVPIHDDFFQILEGWYQEDVDRYDKKKARTMNIVHYWGRKLTTVKRAWRAALDGAKITRRLRPYDLRHRFITLALENGADIGALADIVGSKPETLRKYYQHVTREMHRRTVNQITGLGTYFVPKNPR